MPAVYKYFVWCLKVETAVAAAEEKSWLRRRRSRRGRWEGIGGRVEGREEEGGEEEDEKKYSYRTKQTKKYSYRTINKQNDKVKAFTSSNGSEIYLVNNPRYVFFSLQ